MEKPKLEEAPKAGLGAAQTGSSDLIGPSEMEKPKLEEAPKAGLRAAEIGSSDLIGPSEMGYSSDPIGQSKDMLRRLSNLLELVSAVENPGEPAKDWREEARVLCYELEDAIDNKKAEGAEASLLERAMKARVKFNDLSPWWQSSYRAEPREDVPPPDASCFLVGMEDPTNKIIKLLDHHMVISIVGLQGSGKTTLAAQVFNKISMKFDCMALVFMTRKPNVKGILINLLKQFGDKHERPDDLHESTLVRLIQKKVQDKRFLVVAEDVWDKNAWTMVIRCALLQNNSSGRIIMTTCINDIASLGDYVYRICPLSEENSKSLLLKKVFDSEQCPSDLEDLRDKILGKCGGLPLAITAISDVLKKDNSRAHWRKTYDSISNADAEDSIKSMRSRLSLGYYELPYNLRMCLLYLSIFPARHEIKRKRLVHRWIAQGLVHAQYGENVAELGERYFDELINRNWIGPVNVKYDGQARACRVHNVILDFIVCKSAEENFATLFGCTKNRQKNIHNLSIQNMQDVPYLPQVTHVRSLTIFGHFERLPVPMENYGRLLRVLDFEDCKPAAPLGYDDVVDASNLLQLRYLSLGAACTRCYKVTKMQHLETIDLRQVEKEYNYLDITGLQQVVTLLVDSNTILGAEIGKLKALEEVKYISVSKHSEEFLKELGQLNKLRVLGIVLDAPETSNEQKQKAMATVASLHELGNCKLHSLYIDGIGEISLDLVSKGDSPKPALPSIRKLKLRKWCYISEVPRWMDSIKNLEKLRLGVSKMSQKQLGILGGLPCLVDLFLDIVEVHGKKIIFQRNKGFPYLKFLGISCTTRMKVEFESESVPCLEHLKFHLDVRGISQSRVSDETGNIIQGIKHLSSLIRFDAVIYSSRETDEVVQSALAHMKKEARDNDMEKEARKNNMEKEARDNDMEKEAWDNLMFECTVKPQRTESVGEALCCLLNKVTELNEDQVRELKVGIEKKRLQDMLQGMLCFLQMLSDDENPSHQVREWKSTVRELCYDMEDAIHYRSGASKYPSYSYRSMALRDSPYSYRSRMGEKLKASFEKMDALLPKRTNENPEAGERIANYMSGTSSSSGGSNAIDPRVAALHGEAATLVGTDAQRDTIIRLLTAQGEPSSTSSSAAGAHRRLKVVSIFGLGGVGKTALAKQVFHCIKGQFDCSAIVPLSRKFSIYDLIADILWQIEDRSETTAVKRNRRNPIILNGKQPHEYVTVLRHYTKDKRYLFVLDDIWRENYWNKIEDVLSDNNRGSRILTTTRIKSVAKKCCFPDDPIELEPLNNENSKKLFLQRSFGSAKCPSHLEEACNGIVKKCGGSPLAILIVSSLLVNNNLLSRWEEVRESLGPGISMEPGAGDMRSTLSLSYYDLPCPIRMCLLYLSIFPEDYEINRKDLIRRWIAQGLIDALPGENRYSSGQNCFNELINRSLIQPVKIRYDGKVKACRVHDTILDFIVSKSIEDNFVTLLCAQDKVSDKKIRHLSIQNIQEADVANLELLDLSHVRSVSTFGLLKKILRFMHLPMLRVLDLQCYDPDPWSIRDYFGISYQLEYFKLSSDDIIWQSNVPFESGQLVHLQTLDLTYTAFLIFPVSTTQLTNLVHLFLNSDARFPDEIGQMEALEELKCVRVDLQSEKFLKELGKLSKLRILSISFWASRIDEKKEQELLSSLRTLGCSGNLHSLNIQVLDNSTSDLLQDAELVTFESEWRPAVQNLHKLSMKTGYVRMIPSWMGNMEKLQKLALGVYCMNKEGLNILGRLQGLRDLFLSLNTFSGKSLVFSSSNGFQTLEYFGIRSTIKGMTNLMFEAKFMPSVKCFRLELDARDRKMPEYGVPDFGIQHLSSLRMVHVNIHCCQRTDEVVEATMAAIQNAVNIHHNRPTVKFEIFVPRRQYKEEKVDIQEEKEVEDIQDEEADIQEEEMGDVTASGPEPSAGQKVSLSRKMKMYEDPPAEISHQAHSAHKLKLVTTAGAPYICDGCKERGDGPRYTCHCSGNNFDLHMCCALAEATLVHPLFDGPAFVFLTQPPPPVALTVCDVCGDPAHGFVYHCYKRDLDIHPCCASLPLSATFGSHAFELRAEAPRRCGACSEKGHRRKFWAYRAVHDDGGYVYLHVACVKRMASRSWEQAYQDRVGGGGGGGIVRASETMVEGVLSLPRRTQGRSKGFEKFLKIATVVANMVIAVIFGNPMTTLAVVAGPGGSLRG